MCTCSSTRPETPCLNIKITYKKLYKKVNLTSDY